MDGDEDCRIKAARHLAGQEQQGLDAPRRRSDCQNIAVGHLASTASPQAQRLVARLVPRLHMITVSKARYATKINAGESLPGMECEHARGYPSRYGDFESDGHGGQRQRTREPERWSPLR